MLTFSCKTISQEDLVRCAFDLNKTEYNVLVFLLKKNERRTATQISESMKLDRTTVQKAIKKLVEKGLVKRSQINLSGGGYTFFYKINNRDEIKEKMKNVTHKWYRRVEEAINML